MYDAHGFVTVWAYSDGDFDGDFDRDGDVDTTDQTTFNAILSGGGFGLNPTPDPTGDFDMDGDTDATDSSTFTTIKNGGGAVAEIYTSGVGNTYFFTGRRLFHYEAAAEVTPSLDPQANQQVQYNRARFYDPENGRWLQREPLPIVPSGLLYVYARVSPSRFLDWTGNYPEEPENPINEEIGKYNGGGCGCPPAPPKLKFKGCSKKVTNGFTKSVWKTASRWCDILACMDDPQYRAAIEKCFKDQGLFDPWVPNAPTAGPIPPIVPDLDDVKDQLCKALRSLNDKNRPREIECVCCANLRYKTTGPMHTPSPGFWSFDWTGQPIRICTDANRQNQDFLGWLKGSHELLRWWIGEGRTIWGNNKWDDIVRWDDAINCAFTAGIGKCGSTVKAPAQDDPSVDR